VKKLLKQYVGKYKLSSLLLHVM